MKKLGGFTVIELLVVVAVITVLVSITSLTYLLDYKNRAKNAAIKAEADIILKNSAVYYSNAGNGSYYGFFGSLGYLNPAFAAYKFSGSGVNYACDNSCGPAMTRWCVCINLKIAKDAPDGSTYCTNSSGYKKQTVNGCGRRCNSPALPGKCLD